MDTNKRMKKALKILSIPVDKGGCGWYRVRQPFQAINEFTDSQAHVIDKESDDPMEILEALCQADILVVRQGGEIGVDALKDSANAYAKETGKKLGFHAKIVLDIDDNIELISPYSEHYKEYGTKEFYDQNQKKWIWKDGKDFNLVHNRHRILNLLLGMRKADLVTVTTPKLAEYARLYNKRVAVLPNAINTAKWWQPPLIHDKQIRVGWSGGHSHYEDWYSIKKPLNDLLRKYHFKLVFVGTGFSGLVDDDLRDLVEEHPWVPFEAHSYRMMCMNLDLAIVPLADLPFNHYKSPIKWLEFSAMGVPSIVANVSPYREAILPKGDGSKAGPALLYRNDEEFYSLLETFLLNEDIRRQFGQDAKRVMESKWTAKQHAKTWIDAYRAIL